MLVKSRILQKVNTLVFGIINEVVQLLMQYTDTVGVLRYVVLFYILPIVTFFFSRHNSTKFCACADQPYILS